HGRQHARRGRAGATPHHGPRERAQGLEAALGDAGRTRRGARPPLHRARSEHAARQTDAGGGDGPPRSAAGATKKVPPRLGPSDAPSRVSAPARADAAPWQRALAQHTEPDAAPRRTDTPAPETAPEDGDDGAPAATTDDAVAELAELLLPIAWPTPP